jgi:hypothetical protein
MRGIDCTPEQLEAAEVFLMERRAIVGGKRPKLISMCFDDLVRLVAWYGALRFKSGRDGLGGTLEKPGPVKVILP